MSTNFRVSVNCGFSFVGSFSTNSYPVITQTPTPSFIVILEFVPGNKRDIHYLLTNFLRAEYLQVFVEIAVLLFDVFVLVASFVGAAMFARVVLPAPLRRGAPTTL